MGDWEPAVSLGIIAFSFVLAYLAVSLGKKNELDTEFTWFRKALVIGFFFLSITMAGIGLAVVRLIADANFGGNMTNLLNAALSVYIPFMVIVLLLSLAFAFIELSHYVINFFKKARGKRVKKKNEKETEE